MTAPVITALPTAPSRSNDPDTFVSRADAWVAAISTWTSEANALGTWSNNTATTVQSNTTTSTTAASNASASASAAAASAASALNSATTQGTSTTSNTLGIGSKTFTTQTGKGFVAGMYVLITATTGNWMHGQIISYTSGSGSVTINIERYNGTFGATFASWSIALSAPTALITPVTKRVGSTTNLMLYSQDFTNAAWVKFQCGINTGISDPFGTLGASKLYETAITGAHGLISPTPSSLVVGDVCTLSCYMKAGERTWAYLYASKFGVNSGAIVVFDLVNGLIVNNSGFESLSQSAGIESVGGGWFRCWISGIILGETPNFTIGIASSSTTTSYAGDGTSGIYLYGVQVEKATTIPNQYVTTTSASVSGSGKVATNIYSYYSELPLPNTNNVTTASNNIIAPNGTLTGAKHVPTVTNGPHEAWFVQSWVQNRTYILTCYVRWDGSFVNEIRLSPSSLIGGGEFTFNFQSTPQGNGDTCIPVGGGWYRVQMTIVPTATTTAYFFLTIGSNGSYAFAGDGNAGLFTWGWQLEEALTPGGYVKVDNGVSQTSSHAVAQLNSVVEVDTSKAALTIALPHNPTKNSYVEFYDTSEGFIINPLTIQRNTKTIENLHEDMIVSSNINGFKMVYNGITWKVV